MGSKTLLIYPPLADPTQPYTSLPTLKGSFPHFRIEDWNIEGLHALLKKDHEAPFKARLKTLETKKRKTFFESWETLSFHEATGTLKKKWKNLLNEKDFYHWGKYQEARRDLELLMKKLSALSFPYEFSFNKNQPRLTPWDEDALQNYLAEEKSPFFSFYKKKLQKKDYEVFGISLVFSSQLAETFTICSLIKKLYPKAFIILGGPGLHQLATQMEKMKLPFFFSYADALCLYEGEPCFQAIEKFSANELRSQLSEIPNILYLEKGEIKETKIEVFDLKNSPPPDYSDYDLQNYLAPSPLLLYAPTRGCYWNKCSFCYYGFNQSQTHRYREKSPEEAAKDLLFLSKKYKTKHFYLSGDVLSPAFAVGLARELKGKKIFWATDLRIEKYFTKERCLELYEGGLRAVAFGIESGSDRMLCEVINKGTTRELASQINKNFAEAKIATAWMTFLHHPKETIQDAEETLLWLEQEKERLSLFIIGEFGLTPGSRIYASPEKFNLKKIYYTRGDLFHLYPLFEEKTKYSSKDYVEELGSRIDELSSLFALAPYPWAGAISTHHSFLYLLRYGPSFFKEAPLPQNPPETLKVLKERDRIYAKLSPYLDQALKEKKGLAPLSFKHLREFF